MVINQKILKVKIYSLKQQISLCETNLDAAIRELENMDAEIELLEKQRLMLKGKRKINWTYEQIKDWIDIFDELIVKHANLSNELKRLENAKTIG